MKYELHPCYFYTDFGAAIFEYHSVTLTQSHPPVPIKRKKEQQKNFWTP